jgi:hypothetical protein
MNAGGTLVAMGWLVDLPCIGSRVTANQLVFLALAAG